LIITREDASSHSNQRIDYVLYRVVQDGLEEIASIRIHNGTPRFSDSELENIYAMAGAGEGSRAIASLIQYARARGLI